MVDKKNRAVVDFPNDEQFEALTEAAKARGFNSLASFCRVAAIEKMGRDAMHDRSNEK